MTAVDSPVCNSVRARVSKDAIHTSSLTRDGCPLHKTDLPEPHILVNLDKVASINQQTRADFMLAADCSGGWIVPIEMKKGAPRISKAVGQLQSAAQIVEKWVKSCHVQNFRPVLVTGSMPTNAIRELKSRSNRVIFLGNPYPIERIRCGSILASVLQGPVRT